MKAVILGRGFIATHFFMDPLYTRVGSKVRLNNISDIEQVIEEHKPDVIINAIGFCGKPNVDQCEIEKDKTSFANVALPIMLAQATAKHSIHLVHIGSGCIYFGESPNYHYLQGDGSPWPDMGYSTQSFTVIVPGIKVDDGWKETDFANPQSFYSKTKYACDLAIGDMSHVTTLRIRMPISEYYDGRNLITKLSNYKQIINIPNSVTFMTDFERCVDWTIQQGKTGIFHITNPDTLTAAQIMREYQKYRPEHYFTTISERELDNLTIAKRSNCILNTDKLTNAGFIMTPAEEALKECMNNYFIRLNLA